MTKRIDELLSEMTLAEKAGQLTQYFYFTQPQGAPAQPHHVEAALARGEAGSLLFVTGPAETNRLQRLAIDGPSSRPRCRPTAW